jgi:hypothetical protein
MTHLQGVIRHRQPELIDLTDSLDLVLQSLAADVDHILNVMGE